MKTIRPEVSEFVRAQMDKKNLSYADVAQRSGSPGITHGTVWNIVNGRVTEIKDATLKALARGLGVNEKELSRIAEDKPSPEEDEEFQKSLFYRLYQLRRDSDDKEMNTIIDFAMRVLTEKIEAEKAESDLSQEASMGRQK